ICVAFWSRGQMMRETPGGSLSVLLRAPEPSGVRGTVRAGTQSNAVASPVAAAARSRVRSSKECRSSRARGSGRRERLIQPNEPALEEFSRHKRYVPVGPWRVAYIDEGHGPPVVLLHGCPFHSFQWRDVIPDCETTTVCLPPTSSAWGTLRFGSRLTAGFRTESRRSAGE